MTQYYQYFLQRKNTELFYHDVASTQTQSQKKKVSDVSFKITMAQRTQ